MASIDYQQQLFKVMPLPSVVLAGNIPFYTIVYVNDAFLKTINLTENDVIGKSIFELFPNNPNNLSADGVRVLTISLATSLETKQPQKTVYQQYDIPIRGSENFEVRFFDCETTPILNNNGTVEFLLYTIVDVTKKVVHQQASNTLQHRNELIENVLESLPFGIAINKISDGSTTMVNEQFCNIYGWNKEDIKDTTSFFEKIYPDPTYRNQIAKRMLADIQSGDPEKMSRSDITITTKTGEQRIIKAKNIPLFNQDLMISTITDVTKSTKLYLEINRIKSNQDALINGTKDLIWSIDVNYCIITANKAYLQTIEATTQVTPKEGDSIFCEAFGEELIIKWRDYYAKGLSGQHYSITEHFYNSSSQRNDYRLISFYPMYNQEGKLFGVACYAKDITDDIQIQKALEHTKSKLNKILDVSLDVICVVNAEGIFLQVSAAAFTIWGYKPEEMIGKNIDKFIYEQDIQKSQDNAANVKAGKKVTHFENRYIHKNGSLVWMEWSASWDEQSKAKYGIARDITEFKKNEAALIESEKKYKNLFENNPSPIFIWDFETLQILDCNQEALLKYGYTKQEFLQLTIKDIRLAEDILLIENAILLEEANGVIHKQIWRHIKKNGDIIFMDISSHLIEYNGKKAALLVLIDVTEKLKVEAQIKASESKYRSLVERSLDAILLSVKNGYVISANTSACKIFQMTEEEICNAGREELVDVTDPRLQILLHERELTGKATGELTFKRKDGTTFSGEVSSVIFKDINGEEKSSITIRDVTDIKKVTAQKDNLLYVLQKSLNEIYIINSKTLLFEYVNEGGLKNLAFSLPQMLEMTAFDVMPQITDTSFKQLIQPLLTKEKEKIVFETIHKRADNSSYDVEVHLQLIQNENQIVFLAVILDITDRKIAEIALKNSEEKYKILFLKNPLSKWIYDIETFTILEVNNTAIDHYGYTKEEFLSMTIIDLRPESEIPHFLNVQKNIKSREGIIRFGIFTHQKKDGTKIQVEVSGNKFSYQNKDCMMVVCLDITDKQKALQELLQSNQRFNYATKATSEAIWDWDIIENTLFWSEGFEIIFGYEKQPFVKDIIYWTKYLHPQDVDRLLHSISVLLNSNETNWEEEFRYIKADDTYAFVVNRGFVIRDPQGKAIRMVGAMRDISKRKLEEQHRKLLESVINNATDCVLITEIELYDESEPRIVYVNEAFTKMTGYSPADVIGKTLKLLQGLKSDKETLQQLDKALRNFESCELTTINYKKNGEAFWVQMNISPVADAKGWFTHWIAIQKDVTKQKKVELSELLLKTITELFNNPQDLTQILQQVLAQLANYIDISMAEVWLIGSDKKSINLISYYAQTQAIQDFYNATTQYNSYVKGESLPGKVWEKETIQVWPTLPELENFIRKDAAKKAGLQSACGLPIIYNNAVIGTVILASTKQQPNTNVYEDLFKAIFATIGIEIKRKLAEEAIKESDERIRLIMNAALDAIICIDTKGNITFWNPQAEAIFGWKEAEVMGKNLVTFIIPEVYHSKHTDGMTEYLKTGNQHILNVLIELTAIKRTGETIPIELTIIPIKQANGEFFCAFIRDITHRKQSEEKLKSERNLLRTLIDNLPDTIYVKNIKGEKIISNKVDYTLIGKNNEADVIGKTDLELFNNKIDHIGYNQDMEILQTGLPIFNFEDSFINQNGLPIWLLTTKVALLNEQKEIIGILGIGRDITDRKIAEDKLKASNSNLEKYVKEIIASNQELEQFAYVASHDLQEPLRMITSFLTQLEKKYNNILDEKGKSYINFAVDGAKRMRQIILDLLEYSRVGKTDSQLEQVDLNVIIDEIKILCSKQIKEKKAIITIAHLPTIISHTAPMRQVFQNLISNALKYTKPFTVNTTIDISVLQVNNDWQFTIADNGIGIGKDYFDKIFVIFQRLHTKEEFAGTGMGLAVTKKIIDNMGGRIWVESVEGAGSTFYFTIPKTNF